MKRNPFLNHLPLPMNFLKQGLFLLFMINVLASEAQVNFIQTLNADFNKGALNNVQVASDNISLQYTATDPGTWLTSTVLPQTLTGHRAVSWNNRYAYVVGGYNSLNYVNTVYMGSITTGGVSGWTAQNPLPVALRDPAVVIGTNTIYVIGGRDAAQVYNTIYYAAINYDGTLGAWQTSLVPLPAARWGHTATYLRGFIYVIGGSGSLTETTALNTVYFAKVNAMNTLSAFTLGSYLPLNRNRHATVCYNGVLYVLGGYDNTGTKSNTVYTATPALAGTTGSWTTGTSLPVAISNHAAVSTNGMIAVMAGMVGTAPSNAVYFANADAGSLTWTTASNLMYDFTKDGDGFPGNGQIYYTGGTNLSGTPVINCRFTNMTLSATNFVSHGLFVSNPFYELGAERVITSLTFNKVYTAPANLQVSYRTAGADGIWGDWTALVTASPIAVGLTKQYLQYYLVMTGSTVNNSTFTDMTLTTPGTQLTGSLNTTLTFTKAASPYWVTGDISFSSGTHTFEAGATLLFTPNTGMSVSTANLICNGTAVDSVKFIGYNNIPGLWNGLYFDPSSDAGYSSQFYYTVIAGAGNGGNNANLYCNQTNEPLLSRCNIRGADGHGINLNSAHLNIQNSVIRKNSEHGLYLNNSNPTFVTSAISYNGAAGLYLTSTSSIPNYSSSGTSVDHNLYAFRYPSPNFTFLPPQGGPTVTGNTYNGIAMNGGDISSNQRWHTQTFDYILLGSVNIGGYQWSPRLTVEPKNTVKAVTGVQIQVGWCSWNGGELYAIGNSADSTITFTAHNGLPGGWNGIYFNECGDNFSGLSVLDYCTISCGNDYNYFSESTVQPDIDHSVIQNSLLDGARYLSGSGSINTCQFLNNGRYPLYLMNPTANPVHTGNTYTGNTINRIAVGGGTYDGINRTLNNDGAIYYVLDNITIQAYQSHCRLTVDPGVTVEFALGKKVQVGVSAWHGGEFYAQGTALSPIVLKAYNNLPGGWEGINFTSLSDDYGSSSILEYCTIKQGNAYNIFSDNTSQPTMNYCTISNSALHGMVETSSSPQIHYCTFSNNGGYPLKYNTWTCNSHLLGNTYTGNTLNYIALSGGDYSSDITIYNDGVPYHVLGNIRVFGYQWHPRLTVRPGVTMAFNPGLNIQLGSCAWHAGDLWAEGKVDSVITFKPYNNLAGGWNGIYFTNCSDGYGASSSLKFCRVEKGANYNVLCESTPQPAISYSTITQSTGDGLRLTGTSNLIIRNSSFTYNVNGIYFDGSSTATLGNSELYTNNLYNNTGYEIYNNSTTDLNARYNFLRSGDSTMITLKIFDKSDNPAKGRIYYSPFAQVPSLTTTNTIMTGWVKYVNAGANPIKNAAMVIKNFSNTTIASTTSNTSGVYTFPSFASGNYKMSITPAAAWAGCNSTDALNIINHFAAIAPLTGMKLAAADVNYSHTVNGTDALLVMKRYSGQISSFTVGDYLYTCDTVIVSGSNVTNNIEMICFGDVNASNAPAKKSSGSVGLVHEGSVLAESYAEFDFPVRLSTGMQVGAISLGFHYPENYLEITGARLANGVNGFSWSAQNGLFRMGWCDMNALSISDNEIVVILSMKAKDLSGMSQAIALELFEDCEFADGAASPNPGAVVSIPLINTTLTGMQPGNNPSGLSVVPNPVNGSAAISFSLAKTEHISLTLFDLTGRKILEVASADFPAGLNKVTLPAQNIKPGCYLLKLNGVDSESGLSDMIRIVVSN